MVGCRQLVAEETMKELVKNEPAAVTQVDCLGSHALPSLFNAHVVLLHTCFLHLIFIWD